MSSPDPATQPRQFLQHLLHVAVQQALPLHQVAAYLPEPPKGCMLGLTQGLTEDALVPPDTVARAMGLGIKIDEHLDRNDAFGFFKALGDLVLTGPTHTKVNDLRAMLVL
ncbi:MAG: hypothetical protein IPO43_14075 [Rhodoferax sp.]|nr:hypothetical protein [Rhodoferax sp.]